MSHIVQIKTEVRDPSAIQLACQRLGLPQANYGNTKVYNNEVMGYAVSLPDWVYPIVCDIGSGQVHYDNFKGYWGDPSRLDQFLQAYAVEKAKLEARRRGHSCLEQPLSDGRIKLTICVGGAA